MTKRWQAWDQRKQTGFGEEDGTGVKGVDGRWACQISLISTVFMRMEFSATDGFGVNGAVSYVRFQLIIR